MAVAGDETVKEGSAEVLVTPLGTALAVAAALGEGLPEDCADAVPAPGALGVAATGSEAVAPRRSEGEAHAVALGVPPPPLLELGEPLIAEVPVGSPTLLEGDPETGALPEGEPDGAGELEGEEEARALAEASEEALFVGAGAVPVTEPLALRKPLPLTCALPVPPAAAAEALTDRVRTPLALALPVVLARVDAVPPLPAVAVAASRPVALPPELALAPPLALRWGLVDAVAAPPLALTLLLPLRCVVAEAAALPVPPTALAVPPAGVPVPPPEPLGTPLLALGVALPAPTRGVPLPQGEAERVGNTGVALGRPLSLGTPVTAGDALPPVAVALGSKGEGEPVAEGKREALGEGEGEREDCALCDTEGEAVGELERAPLCEEPAEAEALPPPSDGVAVELTLPVPLLLPGPLREIRGLTVGEAVRARLRVKSPLREGEEETLAVLFAVTEAEAQRVPRGVTLGTMEPVPVLVPPPGETEGGAVGMAEALPLLEAFQLAEGAELPVVAPLGVAPLLAQALELPPPPLLAEAEGAQGEGVPEALFPTVPEPSSTPLRVEMPEGVPYVEAEGEPLVLAVPIGVPLGGTVGALLGVDEAQPLAAGVAVAGAEPVLAALTVGALLACDEVEALPEGEAPPEADGLDTPLNVGGGVTPPLSEALPLKEGVAQGEAEGQAEVVTLQLCEPTALPLRSSGEGVVQGEAEALP